MNKLLKLAKGELLMDRKSRMELLEKIQKKRNSRIIVYITGDRRNLETRIATDIFPMFHKHLWQMDNPKKIDLFIYSTGGITIAGYALVNLFKEFCNEFNVIIPFKAHSCATLIALGAKEIVMTKMGQLSPIDPSVEHPLGPITNIPGQQNRIVPVNVEDINAFVDLARKEVGLGGEDSMKKVFEILATHVNPMVLGAIQRSREQITFLAKTLMKENNKNESEVDNIVNILTRQRFSHDYIISRREAMNILKLNISDPDDELTTFIVDLFNAYSNMLMLNSPYTPELVLGSSDFIESNFIRAIIESVDLTHIYRTKKELKKIEVRRPDVSIPQIVYQDRILEDGWVEDGNI